MVIVTYFSDTTVMLDLDLIRFGTVLCWARKAMKRFNLEGFIILLSSVHSYHVVFNRTVTWEENVEIGTWFINSFQHDKMNQYLKIRLDECYMSLRVSTKGMKPKPIVVHKEGKLDGEIADYLKWRADLMNAF